MPKKKTRNPVTFDDHLSSVVTSKREKRGLTQEDLAALTGIPYSTLRRRLDGSPFLVGEVERIAGALGISARLIVEEALEDFGGIDKLMSEATATHEALTEGELRAKYDLAAQTRDAETDYTRDDDPTAHTA